MQQPQASDMQNGGRRKSAAVVAFYAKVQLETHWLWRFSHSPRLRPSASHAWTTDLQFLEQSSSIFLSFFFMTLLPV
jgi:hypothetical protein